MQIEKIKNLSLTICDPYFKFLRILKFYLQFSIKIRQERIKKIKLTASIQFSPFNIWIKL